MNEKNGLPNGSGDANSHVGSGNEPICDVWHGYDVVLTDRYPDKNTSKPKVAGRSDQLLQSWRRTSSDQQEDYGWLRQLHLRSDVPHIEEILDWSFDVLVFEESVLIQVFIKLLECYNFLEKFGLDRITLERYCTKVMDMHHKDCYYQKVDTDQKSEMDGQGIEKEKNPDILCEYHNWYHAVSCAHVVFLFLRLGGADAFLRPVEVFCIIMGALIHDLGHQGTNNDFEVKRRTSLAKLYDNDAVLERHSISTGLKMCQENPELDWLSSFEDGKDREYVKYFLSESVLATDPARHASVVKEALAFVKKGPQDYQSTSTLEASKSDNEPSLPRSPLSYFDKNDLQHRVLIGKLILHSADISNPTHSSFEVASDWAVRVTTEFTRQANKEKQLQLPVTAFMDGIDSEVKIAKVQIGFFHFMVKPLFHTLGLLFPNLKMLEEWGEENCVSYQAVIDQLEMQQKMDAIIDKQTDDSKEGQHSSSASPNGEQKDGAPDMKAGRKEGVETQDVIDLHGAENSAYGRKTGGGEAPF